MKKLLFVLLTFSSLVILITVLFSFNPVKDRQFIVNLKSIINKVAHYEDKTRLLDSELKHYYWKHVELSDSEMQLVEPKGVILERITDGYKATIPIGFDTYFHYDSVKNCWFGDKWFLGVTVCDTED